MKNLKRATSNFTKKDSINARNGFPLQDEENGLVIHVSKAAILEDVDGDTGELKEVSVITDSEGKVYTSVSASIMDIMDDVIDLLDAGESVTLTLVKRESKGKRTFLTFMVQ